MDVFKISVGLTLIWSLPVIVTAEGEQLFNVVVMAPPALLVGFALLISALPKYIKRFHAQRK